MTAAEVDMPEPTEELKPMDPPEPVDELRLMLNEAWVLGGPWS